MSGLGADARHTCEAVRIIERVWVLHIGVVIVSILRRPRKVAVDVGDGGSMDDGYGIEEGRDDKTSEMHCIALVAYEAPGANGSALHGILRDHECCSGLLLS